MANTSEHTGVLLIVRFKTSLSVQELKKQYTERMPLFRDLPGPRQKYYVHDHRHTAYGGIRCD
jgi:hypothetical protein